MDQSSAPNDLIMPALTHIRKPTATHEMTKNAIPTPQIGALLSPMMSTIDVVLGMKVSKTKSLCSNVTTARSAGAHISEGEDGLARGS
jgi:hypothetical protein